MLNIYNYDTELGLVVTQTKSKTLEAIKRKIELGGNPDKFIELYLPTIDPAQISADSWHKHHQLVETLNPDEPKPQVPVFDNGAYTYDGDNNLITELGLNSYDSALAARTGLENDNTWLKGLRGETAPQRPDYVIDVQVWKDENIDHRELRFQEYVKLSPEQKFEHTVGDLLDAIIKHIYGDTVELDALVSKIAEIKDKHPKK